jgi:outer membrane protein OmpA-like peptidoglycan-associated protein
MVGFTSKKSSPKKSAREPNARARKKASRRAWSPSHSDLLFLQRNAGNQAVSHVLQSRTKRETHTVNDAPIVESVLQSNRGQPIDSATRESMESIFGQDLSQVRVHTDAKAAGSADAVNALAYTAGQDIVFGPGQYAPETNEGRELLTHELAHTIEQRDTCVPSDLGAQQSPIIMRAAKPGEPRSLSLLQSEVPTPTVTRVGNGILATVYFGKGDFLLDSANFTAVEKLSEELRLMYQPTVMVDGHASKEGTEQHNLDLSEKRRWAVIAILKSKLIGSLEISGKAYGESQPAVEETAKEGAELESQRALNRRVTIFILSTPAAEKPQKPIDLSLPKLPKPETPEERLERILKEPPPTPPPKKALSEMVREKFDEGIEDILRKAKVPPELRGLVKDGAHALIEKGTEKALDAALGQTGLNDNEKEAVKAAIKALPQTIKF